MNDMRRNAVSPSQWQDPDKSGVNWNEAWKAARAQVGPRGGKEVWDHRAPSFSRGGGRSGYGERMVEFICAKPGWTVLDVGCGPGTLAIPLARLGCSVTALDFSAGMLEQLTKRCVEGGIGTVKPVLGSWDDDWSALGIGQHDVAVASRSLGVDDLEAALLKLEGAARRRVVISSPAGEGPVDRRLFEVVGRTYVSGPDYLYPLNLLLERGVLPTVRFIQADQSRCYASLDDALANLLWMFSKPTRAETGRLKEWLERELHPEENGGYRLPPRTIRWAVISWDKGDGR